MSKFALDRIEAIEGNQDFYKLKIDGVCLLDSFEDENKSNKKYFGEIGSIYGLMERLANNQGLPAKKFRDITPQNEKVKEYEFKSKNLRVYAIKCEGGKIVILGGYKNRQKKDLRTFRGIKKQYLESIK